jgi:hypothetical protein
MRGIRLLAFVAACVTAASCSSTSNIGGTGGAGDGGSGAGGSGQGGAGGQSGTGGQGDAGSSDCSPACGSGLVCVGTGVQGGAVFLADGGVCPPGRHVQGIICIQDLTFTCMPIPSGCNGNVTCSCASSLCNTDGGLGRVCATPQPGELTCVLEAP